MALKLWRVVHEYHDAEPTGSVLRQDSTSHILHEKESSAYRELAELLQEREDFYVKQAKEQAEREAVQYKVIEVEL